MSALNPKQRVTLSDLNEPQQLRELNRQLEWVWNQLMGGLTQKALSPGLSEAIDSKAESEDVEALTGEVTRQATQISQNAAAIALKAGSEAVNALGQRVSATEAELTLVPGRIRAAVEAIDEFGTSGSEVVMNKDEVYIGTPRFTVEINTAGQRFQLDENGGSMGDLTVANRLVAPNMAEKYTGPGTVTVGPGGTYQSFAELSQAVNDKLLDANVTATLISDLSGNAELGGMHGRGALTIDGDGHALAGSLTLRHAGVSVAVADLTVNGTVSLVGSNPVSFSGVTFNGNGGTNALNLQSGSLAILQGCGFYNATNLMRVTPGCWLSAYNSKGGNGTYFLRAERCTVWMDGTRPDGSRSTSCVLCPNDPSNLTVDYGTATPTVTPVTTASFSCIASGTNYNDTHWHGDSRIRQGYYSMTGGNYEQSGCFWFDLSALAGKTIQSATLTLTRAPGYGRSGEVSVKLYTTPLTAASGNPNTSAVSRGTLGTIANGETKMFSVPAAAIGSGAASGFMVYAGDGALLSGRGFSANYAHFCGYGEANPPVLTVTYQ